MQETRYNGPEMSAKKVIILLVTAALILILFLTRTCKQDPVADAPAEEVMRGKELGMVIGPILRDGVAHEHHIGIGLVGDNLLVVSLVVVKSEPILLGITCKPHG